VTLAGDRWFLAGDAAGLVDPITREGIFFALQSAGHAADAIAAGGPAPERAYVERVRHDIVAELIRAADFKTRFFQPRFTRLLVDALNQSPAIARIMADLVAGTQSYRTLKWRLAGTLEGRLAWRLLKAGWLPE
jgi:flavin-dependent dehydrogenase